MHVPALQCEMLLKIIYLMYNVRGDNMYTWVCSPRKESFPTGDRDRIYEIRRQSYPQLVIAGSSESESTDVSSKKAAIEFDACKSDEMIKIDDVDISNTSSNATSNRDSWWVSLLCRTQFFQPCKTHESLRKNECNYFCSGCISTNGSLCRHCVENHQKCGHDQPVFFQIRRYMYRYVVHLDDLNKHFDSTGIQSYCINQRKAVLLNPKDVSTNTSGTPVFENQCMGCKVPLRPDCKYCCLDCKAAVQEYCTDGSITPRTPVSAKKRARPQEPGLVIKRHNQYDSFEGNTDAWRRKAQRRSTTRRKLTRSPDRMRKLLYPCRSAFE